MRLLFWPSTHSKLGGVVSLRTIHRERINISAHLFAFAFSPWLTITPEHIRKAQWDRKRENADVGRTPERNEFIRTGGVVGGWGVYFLPIRTFTLSDL